MADPGKFKDDHKWPEWNKAFVNYLSVIPGVNGIPLSYVVHEDQEPQNGMEYLTFNEQMIAHAPLKGQYIEADSHSIHTLLTSFLQGILTKNWIHFSAHCQDGHCDMITLHNHFAGKGNSTHHISDANQIRLTLHYKSKCAFPFSKLLNSMQKMFTVFQEEGEPLTEQAKVDKLLTKVQHSGLTAAIAQLRFQLNTKGVTFTVTANHLNLAISQTLDYQMAQCISSTNSSNRNRCSRGCGGGHNGGCGGCNGYGSRCGCGNNNLTKMTANASGFYPMAEWNKLSFEKRDKTRKECDKKGEPGGTKHIIGDISIEHVTAIIGAMQQAQLASPTEETELTSNTTQVGNSFGSKANVKKSCTIE